MYMDIWNTAHIFSEGYIKKWLNGTRSSIIFELSDKNVTHDLREHLCLEIQQIIWCPHLHNYKKYFFFREELM